MIRVITPYNKPHEKYLTSCEASVIQASYKLDVFHDIQYDWGKGQAWAIRRLLSRVNDDDIVCILDADDMAKSKMFKNIELLKVYDLVYGDVINMDKNGNGNVYEAQPMDLEVFKKKNIIPVSGVVAKGWLLKSEEYPDLFHGKDWLFFHRLLKHSDKFHYEPGVVAIRRTWTSYKRCDIPVYRKFRRLYYNEQVKRLIRKEYETA